MKKLTSIILSFIFFYFPFSLKAFGIENYSKSNPDLFIYVKEIDLKSQLRNYFVAFDVEIENTSGRILKIVDAQFENGKNGGDAYFEARKDADEIARKRVHKWEDWGVWTLGGAWALSFLIVPFEWYAQVYKNRRMKDESLIFCQEKFFNTDFYPNEIIQKLVLFPIDKKFYMRIVVKDYYTNKLYTITKEGADESPDLFDPSLPADQMPTEIPKKPQRTNPSNERL